MEPWFRVMSSISNRFLYNGSIACCFIEVFAREHHMDEEVPKTLARLELVQFGLGEVNLVEFLVLRCDLMLLVADDLTFFSQLVLHEVLHFLPKFDFLHGIQLFIVFTTF